MQSPRGSDPCGVWDLRIVVSVGSLPPFFRVGGGDSLPKAVIAAHAQKKYIGTAAYLTKGCLRRSLKT